jgi:hypothetical protein
MKFRQLADTGVFVSELCLGAMTFGGRGQQWQVIGGLDQSEVDALVHRAIDGGINFIDTADVYSAGESETLLGRALGTRRLDVVLATRVRGRMGKGVNQVGLSRLHIMEAVDASLKRLGPITSTSIRSIASIRSRTSKIRFARSTIWCTPARFGTSAARIWCVAIDEGARDFAQRARPVSVTHRSTRWPAVSWNAK